MATPKQISDLLDRLIADAPCMLDSTHTDNFSGRELVDDDDGALKWTSELILFKSLCGNLIGPWDGRLSPEAGGQANSLKRSIAALETIRYAMDNGLLTRYEDLIFAEAFADLYEQGKHLLSQGYFLAAGVLFRAVLEERLRRLCVANGSMPAKDRPTINDLNNALYKHDAPVYDKGVMQRVTALATVGNDAAHNNPELTREKVEWMERELLDFPKAGG